MEDLLNPIITLDHGRAEDWLAARDAASVPLIVADPPYGIGYHSNHYKDKNPHNPVTADWNFQVGRFLDEAGRVLTDGGAMYLFCRWDVTPLWVPYIAGSGLKLKTIIVWVKDNWSAGDLEGSFGNQYEQILFITKGRHLLRGKRWPNVWQFPRVPATRMVFPTQKPVELLERAILASSDPGDLVFDGFCGSGSTGAACRGTSRACALTDIDRRSLAIASARLGIPTDFAEVAESAPAPGAYWPDFPDPTEWGCHPEELAALLESMRSNRRMIERDGQQVLAFSPPP